MSHDGDFKPLVSHGGDFEPLISQGGDFEPLVSHGGDFVPVFCFIQFYHLRQYHTALKAFRKDLMKDHTQITQGIFVLYLNVH